MTPDELLAVFHRQIRLSAADVPAGWRLDLVGRVRRSYRTEGSDGGFIEAPEGLDDPDAEITLHRDFFIGRGQPVEWKFYGYDEPADLPRRLAGAGFVPEPVEALILGEIERVLAGDSSAAAGLRIRDIETADDFARVADLHAAVWDESDRPVYDQLFAEWRADPERMTVSVVEEQAGGPALSAGWVCFHPGTDFASLWGGSTRREWRNRGLYRALVTHRAAQARDRGFRYLRVDATDNSRPILQRLGLYATTTTTPHMFTP